MSEYERSSAAKIGVEVVTPNIRQRLASGECPICRTRLADYLIELGDTQYGWCLNCALDLNEALGTALDDS